jgi:hypothetical protein
MLLKTVLGKTVLGKIALAKAGATLLWVLAQGLGHDE